MLADRGHLAHAPRPEELIHDLYGALPLLRLAGRRAGLDDAELRALYRPRSSSLDDISWSVADLPLIDEARVLLGPVTSGGEDEPRSYGHIVVDEAQDLSPMQLRMVSRRSLEDGKFWARAARPATRGPRAFRI